MDVILEKLEEIAANNALINEKLDKLTDSVQFLSSKYDELKKNLKGLYDNQEVMDKSLCKVQKDNKKLKKEVLELTEKVDSLERGALECSMNFYPLVETKDENLKKIVQLVCLSAGVDLKDEEIHTLYRRKRRKNGNPGDVVLKCSSVVLRDRIIDGVKKKKVMHTDINIKCQFGRIYGNEELTTTAKDIYYAALKLKKDLQWKYLWVKGGKIYLRKHEGGAVMRLESLEILEKIR